MAEPARYPATVTPPATTNPDSLLDQFWAARSDRERVELGEAILAGPRPQTEHDEDWVELLDDLYDALRRERLFERGLEVVRLRNEAGWHGRPDGRCDEAEMLLRVGRQEDAVALFEQVWAIGDDPWWVGNNAGLAFGDASEHELAVEWLGRGIQAAMADDDPEELVAQMCELRRRSLDELGRSPDAMQQDADAFTDRARRRRHASRERESVLTDAFVGPRGAGSVSIAMAWFPEPEYLQAMALWPGELDRFEGLEHREYCRALEADMRAYTGAGVRVSHVAPLTVAEVTAHAAALGIDPASPAARSGLAAELGPRGQTVSWPPGRNDPCWCGRPVKYKRCCGTVEPDLADVSDTVRAATQIRRRLASPAISDAPDDEPRPQPMARLRAELDAFRDEAAPTGQAADAEEIEDEFCEFVSDVLYGHLLELVRRSRQTSLDDLLAQVQEALDHDVVRGSIRRDAAVRLALAEALSMEDRPGIAFDLAERATADLVADGARPRTVDLAFAATYLVDTDRVDEALQRFHALLADRLEDADAVCEIAGEALCERGYAEQGLPWLRMGVEHALDATPTNRRVVQAAMAQLRRGWAAAGAEPDRALIERVAEALGIDRSGGA